MKKILFLIFNIFYTISTYAQVRETVTIRLIVPTPHTDRLSYYGEPGRMIVTITNRTNQAQEVYLRGTIKGTDNDRYIYTDPDFIPDNLYAISIPAGIGQTVTVPSAFIQKVYHTDNIKYSGTSAAEIKRAGRLGEGCYMVCISAWNMRNHTQRLSAEEMGCTMICVRNIEAPILIKPFEDEQIKPLPVQNIIFSWNRPAGTPPNVRYKLKIVEIFDHSRNPNDAFLSATSPAFFEEEIMGNAYVYGPSAPQLVEGRKYAWAVTAIDPMGEATFQNKGRSEVRAFVYKADKLLNTPVITSPKNNSTVSFALNQPFDINWNASGAPADTRYHLKIAELSSSGDDTRTYNINDANRAFSANQNIFYETTLTTDRLQYGNAQPKLNLGGQYAIQVTASSPSGKNLFENEGKSQPIVFRYGQIGKTVATIKKDTLPKTPTHITGRLLYHFKSDLQGRTFPVANQRVFLRKTYAKRTINSDGSEHFTPSPNLNGIFEPTMLDGVSVETDADGNFTLTCGMTSLDSSGIIPQAAWASYANTKDRPYSGDIGVYYQLETTNPHYKPYNTYLNITPGGTTNLSNIVLDANSYTLAVNVQEVFNQLKGNYVAGAKVKVYRNAYHKNDAQFGIPKFEGDLLDETAIGAAQQDSKVLIAERTTPQGSNTNRPNGFYVYFNNLFKATDTEAYRYRIVLENGTKVVTEISFDQLNKTLVTASAQNQNVLSKPAVETKTTETTSLQSAFNKVGLSELLTAEVITPSKSPTKTTTTAAAKTTANAASKTLQTANLQGSIARDLIPRTKDKWLNYNYNSKPDTAYLTLEKELVSPPRSKVTGKLQYAFKTQKNVQATPYANMPIKLMVVYLTADVKESPGASGSIFVGNSFYNGTINAIANHNFSLINYNYQLSSQRGSVLSVGGKTIEDNYKVLQTVYTDAQGNFEFDFPNAEESGISREGTNWNGISGGLHGSSKVRIKRVYRIVPDIAYYCAPDDDVIVQPYADKNIGTLTSFVQTFNLKVKVQKTNKENLPTKLENFAHVPVKLYRPANSPMQKYRPVVQGVDKNVPVQLFDTPSNSGNTGSSATATNSTSSSSGNTFTSHHGLTYSGSSLSINSSSSAYQLSPSAPSVSVKNMLNNYVLFREGASIDDGEVIFQNVVKSLGNQDIILLQASNEDRESTTNFTTTYLEFPKQSKNTLTAAEYETSKSNAIRSDQTPIGVVNPNQDDPLFNSQFDPNETATAYLRVLPGGTLVRGKVTDQFTDLGVKGVLVKLRVLIKGKNNLGKYLLEESVNTDEGGFFAFKSIEYRLAHLYPEQFRLMGTGETQLSVIYAPGYEIPASWDDIVITKAGPEEGRTGQQIVRNFVLKPIGRGAYGYVVDAENPNQGVAARIQNADNGKWVDTRSHSGPREQPNYSFNQLESSGSYTATLNSLVQQNTQAASKSATNKASTSLGGLGTLNTTVIGGKAQTTLSVNTSNANNSQHSLVKAGVGIADQNAAFKVTGNVDLTKVGNTTAFVGHHQRFDIDIPAKPIKLIIRPYDPAYLTDTVNAYVKDAYQYLDTYPLRKRKHILHIKVVTNDGTVVRGAQVTIDEAEGIVKYTNSQGIAEFEFVNNSTDNFTVRIKNKPQKTLQPFSPSSEEHNLLRAIITPTQNILIVPKSEGNVKSKDDREKRIHTIKVERAMEVTGKVVFENTNTPVANALVYVDEGKGSDSDIHAVTKSDGTYKLAIPIAQSGTQITSKHQSNINQAGIKITASYAEEGKTYLGNTQSLGLKKGQNIPPVNLTIREIGEIDISKIYGFPVRLKSLTKTENNTYRVSGEIFDKEGNENFALSKSETGTRVLAFSDLEVRPSSLRNAAGTPVAVPVSNDIPILNREINIRAFEVFKVKVDMADNQPLLIKKGNTDTTGVLAGQVRIMDNSFNFPSSYMTISKQDFYMGQYAAASASSKLVIPVFRTDQNYARTKFSITSNQGKPIKFKYLGFDGTAETTGERESFIVGDDITLFMNLNTKIQGGIPVALESGKAVIKHDRLERIQTDKSVVLNLDKWKITAKSWELSNSTGGIVLNQNVIFTGRADIPMEKISILPSETGGNSELIFNDNPKGVNTEKIRNNIFLGGNAKVKLYVDQKTEITFIYDPDVGRTPGKGHFKFTLKNDNGKAAHIRNLEGMGTNDKIYIQYLSILSNDEEVFGFEPNSPAITYYNQISFKPGSIYSAFDRLIISGSADLHIPNVPIVGAEFSYIPKSGQGNKLSIRPFDFQFTGNGGTKFKALTGEGAQIFEKNGLGIAGEVMLPGQSTPIKTQLISMVTAGAGQAADIVKKQTEIVIGRYKEEAKNMAAELVDEVLGKPEIRNLRNNIEEQLNQKYNALNQFLPMGEAGQTLKNLAGKWRLVGQGMDIINQIDKNPIGALMQLNGLLDGAVGINIKEEAKNKAKMIAMEAVKGIQDEIPVEAIAEGGIKGDAGKPGMQFDFDFPQGRVFGSLSVPRLQTGAMSLTNLGMELLFDRSGWYFYTGAMINVNIPPSQLIFPVATGMLIGNYRDINPTLEARVTEISISKRLPSTYKTNGLKGFFMVGRKDLLEEINYGVNFFIADFEIGIKAGLEARIYANFGDKSQELGIGAMVFANAYAKLSVLGCSIRGEVDAQLGAKVAFKITDKNPSFTAAACASASLKAKISCLFSGETGVGFQANVKLCAGKSCQKSVDWSVKLTDQRCTESNDFDF
jgi:hypothetical protein